MKGHPAPQRTRRRVPRAAYGAVVLLFTAVELLHMQRSSHVPHNCEGRQDSGWTALRRQVAATSQKGFEEVFATLFALEMQDQLSIREDGPLPPTDGKHELGAVVRNIKVCPVFGGQPLPGMMPGACAHAVLLLACGH